MSTAYDLIREADLLLSSCADLPADEVDARITTFLEGSSDKVAALCAVVTRAENDADFLASEAKSLTAAARSRTNAAERCRRMIAELLIRRRAMGDDPVVRTGGRTVSLRTAVSVVADVEMLPDRYIRRRETVEPDKAAIKEALERGEVIPGASLETTESVSIRPAK